MFKRGDIEQGTALYRCGKPFNTGAVTRSIDSDAFQPSSEISHLSAQESEENITFTTTLGDGVRIYGLGQTIGPLDKRGKRYRIAACQDLPHTPDKEAVNNAIPFFIVSGPETFGVFIDYPSEIFVDAGFTDRNLLTVRVPSKNFDLYIIDGESVAEIVASYLKLTGKPYAPPKWAWGYQQSRWGYPSSGEVREVIHRMRDEKIPCDAIYLDIDYLDDYKVFTYDPKAFSDFEKLISDIHELGFQPVPIVDPGIKVEDGYDVYESGLEEGCYCVDEAGKPYVGAVWPDLVHLPDFLNKKTRKWWGEAHRIYTDLGIHGFWNDMNEPQFFYAPSGLKDAEEITRGIGSKQLPGRESHLLRDEFMHVFKSEHYYKDFFHTLDDGSKVCHHDVHNLYGCYMAMATADGLKELRPNQRYFLISRSGSAGMHRFSAMWTGDNSAWWEHMLLQMRMMLSLNMSGMFYVGADIGGHIGDTSPELAIRWMQLGAFTPLYRNHSHKLGRPKEPWQYDDAATDILRDVIRLRYAFYPYAYSEYMQCIEDLHPFVAPVFFAFDNERTREIEDQFMYGRSLMVAPVHTANATGRFVHLPGKRWLYWEAGRYEDREMVVMEPGDHYVSAPLSKIPLFVKEDSLIVLREPEQYLGEQPLKAITVVGLVVEEAELILYDDDGQTFDYEQGKCSKLCIKATRTGDDVSVNVTTELDSEVPLEIDTVHYELYAADGSVKKGTVTIS